MEIISICVRIAVLTASYCIYDISFMNHMLAGRRSQTPRCIVLWIGLPIKNIVITYLLPASRLDELAVMQVQFIYSVSFIIITYMMLCYTFEGSALKLGIMQIVMEMCSVFLTGIVLPLINWIEGRSDPGSVGVPFQIPDLLIIPVTCGLLRLGLFVLRPWTARIRNYEPRHRKILWAVVGVYIAGGIGSTFIKYAQLGMFRTFVRIPSVILFIPGCIACTYLFFRYRVKTEQTNAFVRAQRELAGLYYSSVRRQIRSMEQDQEKIGAQMKKITAMASQPPEREEDRSQREAGNRIEEEQIRNYLGALREKFDEIQAGIYCKDCLPDSVLCYAAQQCRKRGIRTSFSFQQYDRGDIPENELSEILFRILDYCTDECIVCREKNKGQGESPVLSLCAAAVKNQLLLEFSCCSAKSAGRIRRELRRALMPLLDPYHGELEIEDADRKRFCVRIQRG